ncbi:sucrose transporter 2 isoform X2 [Carex rostrata]
MMNGDSGGGGGGGGSVSIRVPYRHINDAEVELVGLSGDPDLNSKPNGESEDAKPRISTTRLVLSCTVAAGVQFGWALQLSLLTPYIQVQPCVGIWSDKCLSKYGRRRPFILVGCLMICLAVTLVGFSADIGYLLGDTSEHCSVYKGTRYRAAAIFIVGFWMLDLANNTVQGPARALLADLSGPDQCNSANAIFCSWMAVGNILGFSAGASSKWHRWFPFLTTRACCEACGNLKAAFLVAVVFLLFCMLVTLYFANELPLQAPDCTKRSTSDSSPLLHNSKQGVYELYGADDETSANSHDSENDAAARHANIDQNSNLNNDKDETFNDGPGAVLVNILTSLRHLPQGMHSVLLVMALTWLSWFPFFLFDTDWMGREVYHGDPNGDADQKINYDNGVREGAFGLLLNSVVLGIGSFLIDPMCRAIGTRLVWAISNFAVFVCMAATTVLSLLSLKYASSTGIQHVIRENKSIRNAALVVFSLLGLPLSITYSVPFSITAEMTAGQGGGQGLATGVLNLAIVLPQMIVSIGAGPWDALFGGGNIPAFALAAIFALIAGILAIRKLPKHSNSYSSGGFHGFG